ncbi:hypothetical protein [Dongia deserti]|uniref:hypothetical protein n=1 Tax=Dongia deserti TaxID=2268030 RepID=UPI000E6517AC|nr:hypothetical protein [Dongia deserti]
MKIIAMTMVPGLALALAMLGSSAAQAEQYRLLPSETGTICQSATKSDVTTIQGGNDVKIARAKRDTVNAAICVSEGSVSGVNVRWKANGYWKSSGTIGEGCAEILGASKIKVRPVNTNFHEAATYYTCIQE